MPNTPIPVRLRAGPAARRDGLPGDRGPGADAAEAGSRPSSGDASESAAATEPWAPPMRPGHVSAHAAEAAEAVSQHVRATAARMSEALDQMARLLSPTAVPLGLAVLCAQYVSIGQYVPPWTCTVCTTLPPAVVPLLTHSGRFYGRSPGCRRLHHVGPRLRDRRYFVALRRSVRGRVPGTRRPGPLGRSHRHSPCVSGVAFPAQACASERPRAVPADGVLALLPHGSVTVAENA